MFWALVLCHFIADYPLQTDGIVRAKRSLSGLSLHIAIHLLTKIAVIIGLLRISWQDSLPTILAVVACHFAIDYWKNVLMRLRPQWIIFGYIQDQALHILSILLIAYWNVQSSAAGLFDVGSPAVIYATGYILVTQTWFITERLFVYRFKDYEAWVDQQRWPRMMSRAAIYSIPLIGWNMGGLAALGAALLVRVYDLQGRYRWISLLLDVAGVAFFIGLGQLILAVW